MDAVKKKEGDENQHPQGEQPEEGEEILEEELEV